MVRRTREDALKTKEKIMNVAKVLFCKNGYDRTNLCDIADEAGVTRGAVYWHFQNKDELFLELLKNMCNSNTSYYQLVNSDKFEKGHALEDMRLWLLGIRDVLKEEENIIFLRVIGSIVWGNQGSVMVRKLIENFMLELDGRFLSFITKAINLGELPKDVNPQLAANYVNAVIEGYFNIFLNNQSADIIEYADFIVDLIIKQLPNFKIIDDDRA